MYIIVTEDGAIYRRETITTKILKAADAGKITIIRVDGVLPMRYIGNVWEPVEKI
jgi:hypothetical protein